MLQDCSPLPNPLFFSYGEELILFKPIQHLDESVVLLVIVLAGDVHVAEALERNILAMDGSKKT